MGSASSKSKKNFTIYHQRFSSVKIINDQQMQIQIRATLDDYNTWKTNLRKINSFNKQNIFVPLNHSFQKQGWCSENTGIVKITYDNYQFIFQQQLQNRITLGKHLTEQQMWYLLYTLVSTAKDFSFLNKKIGDIRPHNIFVSEAGQIKLGVCFSWPNQASNYQKTLNQKQITYISPQQLQMCRNQKMDNLINSIISESFSIGLTMLHAGLLFNFSSIYNIQKYEMNKKILEQKIQNWIKLSFQSQQDIKTCYSNSLKQIIKNLCNVDPKKRQSSTQIYKLLQPFKQQILNIEPFQLKYCSLYNNQQKFVFNSQFENLKPPTNTSEFQLYNISAQNPNLNINNTQTHYSFVQPSMEWTKRPVNQIPVLGNSQNHYDIFNNYAHSGSNISSNQNILPFNHNKLSSFQQNTSYKTPQTFFTTGERISIKPFESNNDKQTTKYSYPVNMNVNRTNQKITQVFQRKVVMAPPSSILYSANPLKQYTNEVRNIQMAKSQSKQDYTDFLRKIDEQIQKSKNLFPS